MTQRFDYSCWTLQHRAVLFNTTPRT